MTKELKLTDNQRQKLRDWRKHIPERCRKTWDRAMISKSLRAAIRAKCQDCMNWQTGEVRRCDIITCPLWLYRKPIDKEQGLLWDQIKAFVPVLCEIQRLNCAVATPTAEERGL